MRIVYSLFLILLRRVSYTLVRNPSLVNASQTADDAMPHRTSKIDTFIAWRALARWLLEPPQEQARSACTALNARRHCMDG